MRKIREVLRLKWECQYSDRKVARSCGLSRPAVADYVCRAQAVGLSWPLPDDLDESTLEARLFPVAPVAPPSRPLPDWATVHRELTREGVTLMLSGRNTRRHTPRACNTANSVNATGPMPAVSISRCVRCIGRARSASSIMPDTRSRSSTGVPARSGRPRSLSPCSAPAITPTARRHGLRPCQTGSTRTCACWSTFKRFRQS